MREERRAYNIYRRSIFGLWLLLALMSYFASPLLHANWTRCLFFLLLAATYEAVPVQLAELGQIHLTFLVAWSAMLLCPPFQVMFIVFAAMFPVHGLKWAFARAHHCYVVDKKGRIKFLIRPRAFFLGKVSKTLALEWIQRHSYPLKHVVSLLMFNACSIAICAGAAALVYNAVGGTSILDDGVVRMSLWHTILPMIAAAGIYFVLDIAIFSATCVFWENRPEYTSSFRSWYLRWKILILQTVPPMAVRYVLVAVFALTLAWIYAKYGPIFVGALFLPMYFFGHSIKQTEQMKQAYRETITALGTYVQLYHPYTRGHLKRVAELSERLARELNLPADSVRWMPDAGLLHDLGKVGVSEEILDKPGRPTDEEWAKIQEHPVKGAEIISQMEFLDKIVDWVKYHHKWYDGSGYPKDGRNGDVPVEAHIIAVADAFDAMTDDRELALTWSCDSCGYSPGTQERPEVCPQCGAEKKRTYRQPLNLDQAMDELRRGAGTQFNPDVVKAFLRMIEREGVHIGELV